ncbi:MAG: P-II family nitrogen regulator [Armatimonadetes bacterium]|nr:P-II family nitrogen regulator [Armatimonadota bacterium]
MKEIIAIIRPNKIAKTKEILAELGFPALSAAKVLGRGKQKGLAGEVAFPVNPKLAARPGGMKYIPKRLIFLVVGDEDVPLVVAVITKVNRTGEIGDGRIFICPVENAVRIRTQERGAAAIS